MSTILNTLKKLEEEKSILEKPLDVKGMVTQGDIDHPSATFRATFRLGWIIALVLLAVIIGGSWYFLFKPQPLSPDPFKALSLPEPVLVVSSKPQAELKTVSGVPMAGIPGGKAPAQSKPIAVGTVKQTDPPTPLEESKPAPPSIQDILPILELEPETAPAHKIKDLIKNARLTAIKETPVEKPAPRANGHIPGLSIKGIIFFNDGNPANYIFASTPENSSRKLKTGDRIQNVILQSIHSDHVIFKNQDRLIAVGMGG